MTGLLREFRFAWRGLARTPGFSIIAVLTLALGIGATTAVFTLVDRVLLRPLPYAESDRLLSLEHLGRDGQDELPMSPGLYLLYREHAHSLSSLAMHRQTISTLDAGGEPERLTGEVVTPSLFDVLRVAPALGRPLQPADAEEGAEPVVELTDALWRTRFGADPSLVGKTIRLDGTNRRVVGVLPAELGFPNRDARFWIPLRVDPLQAPLGAFGAEGVGRMAPGQTPETVAAELDGLIGNLAQLRPDAGPVIAFLKDVKLKTRVRTLKAAVVGDLGDTLWTLLAMVAFVLLIACANVANLMLVRAEGRQRELAVRVALGAGRGAVARPFLAESVALALMGGLLGVGIAVLAVRATIALAPADLPRLAEVGVDLPVLGFTAVVSLLSALAFGLFPVLRYVRQDLSPALKEGGARGGTAGRERHRVRNALVVTQVALALVLLVGSGLMLRSFVALLGVQPGFRPDGVLTVRVTVPPGEVADPNAVSALFRQLRERIAGQRQVRSVGAVAAVPLSGQISFQAHEIEDHPVGPNEVPPLAYITFADPGYLETMGIPVVEGRALDPRDGANGLRGVVVSRAYAKRWWPNGSALGKRVNIGDDWWQVVGVVGDVHSRGLQQDPEELIYFPTLVGPADQPQSIRSRDVTVRLSGEPTAFLPVLRRILNEINPHIALAEPRTMSEVVRESASRTSFTMAVLGASSLVALLLGMVGIYGVVSYVVGERTREIGVRMALGASGGEVSGMVVRQGLALGVAGVALGLAVAAVGSRLIDSLLYGVGSRDPLTYGAVTVALVAVAALASWIPARRAAAVDPAAALRRE